VTREFARHGGGEYEGVPLDDEKQSMRAWFGFAEPFNWNKSRSIGPLVLTLIIVVVGGLFVLAIAAAFKLLGSAVFGNLPQGAGSSFGLTGIIVAMIGAPFVVWRAFVAQKQVDVAEQGQITDRISKAVEGLGAEKTVKDEGGESTKPNLEVRIGAIYALERIAQDSLRDHIQIMEILCAYIRENAPLRETPKNPFEIWEAKSAQEQDADRGERPDSFGMSFWANKLSKPRTDIQVALEVIGRRKSRQIKVERAATVRGSNVGYRLDLRSTCLQAADLGELDFMHGLFSHAQLQGANLRYAKLQGSDFIRTQLQGGNIHNAHLQAADFRRAQLQGAYLIKTRLQGSNLGWAQLQVADLSRAQLQWANLSAAQLKAADLSGARLQGANLFRARFDQATIFFGANLKGAASKLVDFKSTTISQKQLADMFGDASVTLPGGHGPDHESWPDHWRKEELDRKDFETKWRAFQRSIGQDPENPT
jgi:uncharacterized protein YjbI with pentapeptide repeats/uncharacterized membrane protein (DUF485 family)